MKTKSRYNLIKPITILAIILLQCQVAFSYSQADFDRDGIVAFDDFSVLAHDWLVEDTNKASFFVAASDAPDGIKQQADYVCDGTADDVEIQAAINALPANSDGNIRGVVSSCCGKPEI